MPKVMIATTTYNRAALVERTIKSVLSQTFTDFKYVIIDNGSTDSTWQVLERYSQMDKRIEVYRREKNSIDLSLIKYVNDIIFADDCPCFMSIDDDDYMDKEAVTTLVELLEKNDADISVIGSKFVNEKNELSDKFVFEGTYTFNTEEALTELLKREKFNSARGGKLFKKDILKIELPSVERVRDIYREYRVIANAKKVVVSGEPLFYYYRHDSNLSGLNTVEDITPYKMEEHLLANTMRTEWIKARFPNLSSFVEYSEISFMISLYNRILKLEVAECYPINEKMLEMIKEIYRNNLHFSFLKDHEKKFIKELL